MAVSIFVNPTQFGPTRTSTATRARSSRIWPGAQTNGVDLVFAPAVEEMYPPAATDIVVDLPSLSTVLEGKHRPGHFKGVCQVVAKLFNILRPNIAFFGQKDYQQLRIIAAMVEALNMDIEVVGCPTIRDPDGLAMSSRNAYLSPEERQKALAISRALGIAAGRVPLRRPADQPPADHDAEGDPRKAPDDRLRRRRRCDEPEAGRSDQWPTVLAVAARVGKTRLIDNAIVEP